MRLFFFHRYTSPTPDSPSSNTIDVGKRSIVYCTAVANGDSNVWQFLFQRYLNGDNANEKSTILGALGCSADAQTLDL